jgi:hypothetical protein
MLVARFQPNDFWMHSPANGLSQPRHCGDDVLRMLVTGGPPVRGGDGMPHRIRINFRPVPALRMTGAE